MTTNTKVRKAFTGDHVLQYDQKSQQANWLDPDIVFGLAYRYINPGETILDVGIGTGLSSILFHNAGLNVQGMDFSSEMLEMCRKKGFASELLQHDVSVAPYPFKEGSVNHAVCTGVMHLFSNLDVIFNEVFRIMKKDGIFAFVVADADAEKPQGEFTSCRNGQTGKIKFNLHSQSSLENLYERYGFEHVNSLKFTSAAIGRQDRGYRAYIARKS